jgi:hypothetical protein
LIVWVYTTATKRGGIENTLKATAQDLITSFPFAQENHKHQSRPEENKSNNTITSGKPKFMHTSCNSQGIPILKRQE